MCAVLILALALCLFSLFYQNKTLEALNVTRTEAINLMNAQREDDALEKITELANQFKSKSKVLEILAAHNDLQDAYVHIVTAQISLERRDLNDAYRELTLLGEAINHLQEHEAFSINNLY
jgi:hypothetical protein